MIRLNSWHESVSLTSNDQQRLSDLIPSNTEIKQDDFVGDRRPPKRRQDIVHDGLLSELTKLQKREPVCDIQFWTDYHTFKSHGTIAQRCICVKALSNSNRLTDDLFRFSVEDENARLATLYLSIRWMISQGNLADRSIAGIMNGRSLDHGVMLGEALCLYDEVISNDTIFADKFHLLF